MDSTIQPIQTKYLNRFFRSRLEARWAVFFTELGIKFEYEYEGFDLSNGQKYLPDFWLPTFDGGIWAEVKPDGGDFFKARMFCNDYGERMWFCEGSPSKAIYKIYVGKGCKGWEYVEGSYECGIPVWADAYDENRMFIQPCCFGDHCWHLCRGNEPIALSDEQFNIGDSGFITNAIREALSARFENGR